MGAAAGGGFARSIILAATARYFPRAISHSCASEDAVASTVVSTETDTIFITEVSNAVSSAGAVFVAEDTEPSGIHLGPLDL